MPIIQNKKTFDRLYSSSNDFKENLKLFSPTKVGKALYVAADGKRTETPNILQALFEKFKGMIHLRRNDTHSRLTENEKSNKEASTNTKDESHSSNKGHLTTKLALGALGLIGGAFFARTYYAHSLSDNASNNLSPFQVRWNPTEISSFQTPLHESSPLSVFPKISSSDQLPLQGSIIDPTTAIVYAIGLGSLAIAWFISKELKIVQKELGKPSELEALMDQVEVESDKSISTPVKIIQEELKKLPELETLMNHEGIGPDKPISKKLKIIQEEPGKPYFFVLDDQINLDEFEKIKGDKQEKEKVLQFVKNLNEKKKIQWNFQWSNDQTIKLIENIIKLQIKFIDSEDLLPLFKEKERYENIIAILTIIKDLSLEDINKLMIYLRKIEEYNLLHCINSNGNGYVFWLGHLKQLYLLHNRTIDEEAIDCTKEIVRATNRRMDRRIIPIILKELLQIPSAKRNLVVDFLNSFSCNNLLQCFFSDWYDEAKLKAYIGLFGDDEAREKSIQFLRNFFELKFSPDHKSLESINFFITQLLKYNLGLPEDLLKRMQELIKALEIAEPLTECLGPYLDDPKAFYRSFINIEKEKSSVNLLKGVLELKISDEKESSLAVKMTKAYFRF